MEKGCIAMYTLEPAREADILRCGEILDEGRAFQRAQGFVQWTEDYPNTDTVRADVRARKGYVIRSGGAIAAYLCVDFDGEPAYREIQGAWQTEPPYAVVHRMAFAGEFRGRGLTDTAFRLIEALCLERGVRSLRVDTGFFNRRMQHILEKNGFCHRGTIFYQGGARMAYDKSL